MNIFKKPLVKLHKFIKTKDKEIRQLEKENIAPNKGKRGPLRDKLAAIFGLIILALAIAGIVFSVLFFRHLVTHQDELNHQAKIEYYTDFIAPAVLFDTGEYNSKDNTNNLSLLIPSFFKAQEIVYATGEERETITRTDVRSRYIIREEDVQKAAKILFGKEVICHSFTLDGLLFEYVENEQYFLSPTTLWLAMYTPNITHMKEIENGVELTVEYVEVSAPGLYKKGDTMKFTLIGEYQKEVITSIVRVDS